MSNRGSAGFGEGSAEGTGEAFAVHRAVFALFAHTAVFDEAVGQTETLHRHLNAVVGQEFEHGRTDAAFARGVFDDDEAAVRARYI